MKAVWFVDTKHFEAFFLYPRFDESILISVQMRWYLNIFHGFRRIRMSWVPPLCSNIFSVILSKSFSIFAPFRTDQISIPQIAPTSFLTNFSAFANQFFDNMTSLSTNMNHSVFTNLMAVCLALPRVPFSWTNFMFP